MLLLPARIRSNCFSLRLFLRTIRTAGVPHGLDWFTECLHLYLLAVFVVAAAVVATIPPLSCGHRILNCVMLNAVRREIVSWAHIVCTSRAQTAANGEVHAERDCCPFVPCPSHGAHCVYEQNETKKMAPNETIFLPVIQPVNVQLDSACECVCV